MALSYDEQPVRIAGAWGAVFSMALAAFVLVASEFMPVSLLPLVAHGITAGAIGGLLFDTVGWWGPFVLSTAILAASSVLAVAAWRNSKGTVA
ncbi:hypothetical protein [Rhizobium sp. LjRoot254]|uniref:hypothetical protein n=1 Tax=Rhizobium sp. LjRoot254 TaxID=3342297 RepID=UPI003ECD8B6C